MARIRFAATFALAMVTAACAGPVTPDPVRNTSVPVPPTAAPAPAVPAPPTADDFPPPMADLRIQVNGEPADANAIINIDTLVFDASRSTGEGLSYHIDYQDGSGSDGAHAERPARKAGANWARLTVTDRFGRRTTDRDDYYLFQLDDRGLFEAYWVCDNGFQNFWFTSEAPSMTGGFYDRPSDTFAPLTGSITSDRRVHLEFEAPSAAGRRVLDGTIYVEKNLFYSTPRMDVIQRGGPFEGRPVTCHQNRG